MPSSLSQVQPQKIWTSFFSEAFPNDKYARDRFSLDFEAILRLSCVKSVHLGTDYDREQEKTFSDILSLIFRTSNFILPEILPPPAPA